MLPDLSVPPHWPPTVPPAPCETHQDALRILSKIRGMIVAYRYKDKGWRFQHAQEAYIVNVVAGLIADAKAIDAFCDSANEDAERANERAKKAEEALAEHKRPFSAQMEMQNRRIIALNSEIDRLKAENERKDR